MTMVATPSVIGVLQSTAPAGATVMTVDAAYATYLTALLTSGQWTYAQVRVCRSVEIIKITGITGQVITVTRGIDNTAPLSLAAGALIQFTMGASAIADLIAVAALAPALVLTSNDASVTITSTSTNNFDLSVPVTEVTSNDGSLIVTAEGPGVFDVSVNASTAGCCSTSSY
jgi:hypothetical protein